MFVPLLAVRVTPLTETPQMGVARPDCGGTAVDPGQTVGAPTRAT